MNFEHQPGPEQARPIVNLHEVGKRYPGGTIPLHGLSLTIDRGELLAITGPSGSGKSTLLNIIGTLDAATSGTVEIDGQDVSRLPDRRISALRGRRIGFVFQQFQLIDGISAVENVATGMLYSGVRPRRRRQLASRALERVGLAERGNHRPRELSGGEQQRVAIARAVVNEPALVLADEPTGALDTATGQDVMSMLAGLHDDGTTVTVITHDEEVAAWLPRRLVMRDGRIVAEHASGRLRE